MFFIRAARLPAVAVGLSALLRFAPCSLLSLPRPSLGAVSAYFIRPNAGATRNTLPVFPRHTRRQVLSSIQRAAVGHTAQPFPTLHVGLLKFAPSGSMSMMSHRQQASNKEIPSIWRLTEWCCREYTPWGKMGGGGDCNKLGARAPAAHLPLLIVFPTPTIPLPRPSCRKFICIYLPKSLPASGSTESQMERGGW